MAQALVVQVVALVLLLLGILAVNGALHTLLRATSRGDAEELDIREAVAFEHCRAQAVNGIADGVVVIVGGLLLIAATFPFRP